MDLNAAIAAFARRVRPVAGERAVLRMQLDSNLDLIAADRKVIDWLFVNLAADAYDAMPGGGELAVTTSNLELDKTSAAGMSLPAGPYAQMEFTAAIDSLDPGSTVRNIVHQLRGAITAHTIAGGGSVINILLPAASTRSRGNGQWPPVVLVVSDDSEARAVTCDLLKDDGYEVVEAGHGRDAEAILSAREIDLMITDIVMPEQDGLETILSVRAVHPGLKIIAVGESEASYQVRTARLLGADAVMSKPLTRRILKEAVREQIGGARPS